MLMQNNCKNNKSSEKFVVVDRKLLQSDKIKSEIKENYDENSLSVLVNKIVGALNINGVSADKMLTADVSIGEVNSFIDGGKMKDVVTVLEKLKEAMISSVAEEIAEKSPKLVLIAGPSSSGKTTFCKKMAYALEQQGMKPKMLSLDDYYGKPEDCPLDENGEYDYESLYALDLNLLESHLKALIAGEEVILPRYNFAESSREWQSEPMKMEPDSILLIEGIHGLNPELTGGIDDDLVYRIYISGSALKVGKNGRYFLSTDNRLIRRMVRDYKYRGTSAQSTLERWPSVRRGEQRWIVPYQKYANASVNTSFPYELGLLRHEAIPLLKDVPQESAEYYEAIRLLNLLSEIHPVNPDLLPKYSILREFLGGSGYEY